MADLQVAQDERDGGRSVKQETMVERVARTFVERLRGEGVVIWEENIAIATARAAIEAMRDGGMTDAMYFAACDEMDEWTDPADGECIKAVHKAALDAALAEEDKP